MRRKKQQPTSDTLWLTRSAIVVAPIRGRSDTRILGVVFLAIALAVFLYTVSQ